MTAASGPWAVPGISVLTNTVRVPEPGPGNRAHKPDAIRRGLTKSARHAMRAAANNGRWKRTSRMNGAMLLPLILLIGAGRGNRTPMRLPSAASSAIPAFGWVFMGSQIVTRGWFPLPGPYFRCAK